MYPTKLKYHDDEIVELINDRMEYTYHRNILAMLNPNQLVVSNATLKNSKLSKDFYQTYFGKLSLNKDEDVNCSYNITSFE